MPRAASLALASVALLLLPATMALPPPLLGDAPDCGGGPECIPGEEPRAYAWRTWVLAKASELRPGFPPEAGSVAWAEDLAAVKRAQVERTPEQAERARFWDEGPAGQRWTELTLQMAGAHGPNPVRVARGLALVHVAMYDALVAAWDAKHFYNRSGPASLDPTLMPVVPARDNPSYPSEHAVAAGAASRVLGYLYPQQGLEFFEDLADEAARSRVWAGVSWPSDVEAGLELGRRVADKVLAKAAADGHHKPWDGARVTGPCTWNPTPPGYVFPPLEPMWGQVRTWLMANGSQLRAPPPPACRSAEFEAQTLALYEASLRLTDEQKDIARYWADGPNTVTPPGHWFVIALDLLEEHPQSTPRAARTLAYLGAAVHDAGVAVWDTKYTYWWERPVETIRETRDPAWSSFIATPPFPGYVSGHSGFSAASARWLGHVFPEEKVPLRAMASEAAMSRFYGGIHIDADNRVGMDLGRGVADLAIARAAADGAE